MKNKGKVVSREKLMEALWQTDEFVDENALTVNVGRLRKKLEAAGVDSRAVATLCQETFDIRNYDTFTLPAGVYESLRIVIGEGEGKNWWCVAFPTLCLSATTEGFEEAAQTGGMDAGLTQTLSNGEPYQLRFYLLDAFGRLENLCFHG